MIKQDRLRFLERSAPGLNQSAFATSPPSRLRRFGGTTPACVHEREVGEYRARTGDLLVANQALSQLS